MTRKVVVRPDARADLKSIFDWIERAAGPEQALNYVRRIRVQYLSLVDFPNRGTSRGDLAPGVRTWSFEGRATIAYTVQEDAVVILRILHKGRDIGRVFSP